MTNEEQPAGLDVERLARAVLIAAREDNRRSTDDGFEWYGSADEMAEGIAAAYNASPETRLRYPQNADIATRLGWLADRLVMVHGESENVDYILHTRSMAAALAATPTQSGAEGPARWAVPASAKGTSIAVDEWGRQLYIITEDRPRLTAKP